MIVKLGYIYKPLTLEEEISFQTTTYTSYQNNNKKLHNIINHNLDTLKEILIFNQKNNIHFFRITSALIPLATIKDIDLDYIYPFFDKYKQIGKIILDSNIRVDMHPDQYTVLNSVKKEVVENSIEILKYHYKLLKAMHIAEPKIILHVGSNAFGKKASITRFINTFRKLPLEIQNSILLENDDKVFNVEDTLEICKKLEIPFVLDYHHHLCNPSENNIEYYLEDIIKTWKNTTPKMHFSSPKSNQKKEFRHHSEYINASEFINFLNILKTTNTNIDIMLEAKGKDLALFRLARQLKYKTNLKFIDETTIEL